MKILQTKNIFFLSIVFSILFTIISTFIYCKDLAITEAGFFTIEDAVTRMHIENPNRKKFCGYPKQIIPWHPQLIKYGSPPAISLAGTFFANTFDYYSFGVFSVTLFPNLLFWSTFSFIFLYVTKLLFKLIFKANSTE